jgi:hypothetical protein
MTPNSSDFNTVHPHKNLPVMLDGKLLGSIDPSNSDMLVKQLRAIKVLQK